VLPAAIDIIQTKLGELYAKELGEIPLADNTVGRKYRIFQKTFVIS
jgi:hypothetical protein